MEPPTLIINPPFSELVARYLRDIGQVWKDIEETLNSESELSENSEIGPDNGILNKEHYRLLCKTECEKRMLRASWRSWKLLGCFENGEAQRRMMVRAAVQWNKRFLLWHEIAGLCSGSEEVREETICKLQELGEKEMKIALRTGRKWTTFYRYEEMYYFWPNFHSRLHYELEQAHEDPDKYLGRQTHSFGSGRKLE